ncbi:MAG: type VI secretion system membrane subunit TssM, partial [Pseudomonadaceae bacterium]
MKSIAYRAVGYLSQGWAKGLAVVLIASLFIWFSGPSIAINEQRLLAPASNRLLIICLLLLIWGLWTAFSLWRKHQENQASKDDPEAAERAERQALIAEEQVELHARNKEANRTLRSNRLYPGRSDRWRRELPWYLLVGPEGSGKSSLLMHSGLEFPLNPNEGNLSSTRYADWYFAEHAVLVDTSGRYLTQADNQLDGLGWQTLLKLLRRRRPRALNGVIVNIPVDLLQHDSEQAMENLARQTRQRLADIHQQLGVEVPVYLVLSKVDKVPGFEAFFDALSSDERDQVFGHSFSQDQDGTQADTVQLMFSDLLKRLHNQVISRLHQERDVQRRGRILDFPQQLGQLGDRLALFIELAFAGNRYQRASRLRGFYLTSAPHQVSDMPDYAGVTAIDSRSSEHNRPWFIHDLMSRVIFPESNLASLDQNEIKRIHRRQRWMLATATASLLIMGVGWALSFSSNHQQLEQVREYQQQARQDAAGLLPSAEAGDLVETLDARYAATQVFSDSQQAVWHQRLGLHQGDRVNPQLQSNYQQALQELLLPRVAGQLENRVHSYQ